MDGRGMEKGHEVGEGALLAIPLPTENNLEVSRLRDTNTGKVYIFARFFKIETL